MRFSIALIIALMAVAGTPLAAQPAVTGSFTVGGSATSPTHGVAFWSESTAVWESGKRILRVLMAGAPIVTDGAAEALDVEETLRDGIDGDFSVITLYEDGSLSNVYVYIDDGAQNYGFNGGRAEVGKIDASGVSGRAWTEGEESIGDTPIAFDITFAVDILPERPPGEALPADGGAPGAAYLAYLAAARSGDFATLVKHLDRAAAASLEQTPEEWRSYELDSLKEMAPQEMTVTGGELFDGWAILEATGSDWTGDAVEGRVKMVRDGDTWRFVDENLEYAW